MKVEKVVAALNSSLRREILKTIAEKPMTVMEVLEKLKEKGIKVEYRETVYRALEKLLDANLVEKYYVKDKGLCYKLLNAILIIDLTKGTIEVK
ncbi:MAG: transcriptional repressor [Candidatus Bathyarchaeia archaeon]